MAKRVYIPVTTREYAEIKGISPRTAQRRISQIEGATQSKRSKKWYIPLSTREYAEAKGVSQSTARRKGISGLTLEEWAGNVLKGEPPTRRELRAAKHFARLVSNNAKRRVNAKTIATRMHHASNRQLDTILGIDSLGPNWYHELQDDYEEDYWDGDDGQPIIYAY